MNEAPTTRSGSSKAKKIFFWIIFILVVVAIAGVSRFKLWLSAPDSQVIEADKGFRKAKETINPEQLRVWALEEIQKYSTTNEANIPNSEIPSYIIELFNEPPAEASVTDYGGQKCVYFYWGGPFFDWSIFIGSTNLVPQYSSEETTTRWVPGIIFSIYDK